MTATENVAVILREGRIITVIGGSVSLYGIIMHANNNYLSFMQGFMPLIRIICGRRSDNLAKTSESTCDKVSIALEKYSAKVYRICFMYLKNKAEAEDAFQDVFLRFMQSKTEFESDEHEKAWICRVAINRCKDIVKSFHYKVVSLDNVAELKFESEQDNTVIDAILNLPQKYKDVVYLFYCEGYKASQIADILRSNENTIYSQLSRARSLLKERLGEDYEC